MRCEEVRRFADIYLDGEFDERERSLFEGHVSGCAECRREMDALIAFRSALRSKVGPAMMPDDVRARIMESIEVAQGKGSRSLAWVKVPAAVGALGLVVVLGYSASSSAPSSDGGPIVEQIIEESLANHQVALPLELEGDEASIQGFVSKAIPEVPSPPLITNTSTRLEGVRLVRVGKNPAVLYKYIHEGHPVSVVQIPNVKVRAARQVSKKVDRPQLVYDGARHGFNISLYQTPSLTTTVVSDMPDNAKLVPAGL